MFPAIIKNKFEELFGIDVRALALMRIGFALIVLTDLFQRSLSLSAHYTDEGVLPRTYAVKLISQYAISAHMMSGSFVFQLVLFIALGVSALCVLVGYRTTHATIATFFLLQSMHFRNFLVNSSADVLLHILLFWAIFLPWGAIWSMDHSRLKPRGVPLRVSSMATFAILVQIAVFYTFAGINKTDQDWAINGTAIYYALHMDELVKPEARILLQFPSLLKFLTLFTYRLETWGPLLLFCFIGTTYIRTLLIAAFFFLHTGLVFSLETGPFQWIAMVALLGFLPSALLDLFKKYPHHPNEHSERFVWPSSRVNLFHMPFYLSVILGLLLVYVFAMNLDPLRKLPFSIPQPLQWVRYTLAIDQHWNMFSPVSKETGWYVVPGKLRDGTVVDVFRRGSSVSWVKPNSIVQLYGDSFWGKYYWNLHSKEYEPYRLPYGQYLCRTWNSQHPRSKQLMAFDIIFIYENILENNQYSDPRNIVLWSHYCYEPLGPVPVFKEAQLKKL